MFNHDFQPSHSQMTEMLKEADLEGYGYEKEVTSSLKQMPGSEERRYERTHLYYKIVSCWQLQEVYQEIHRLLPGNNLAKKFFYNADRKLITKDVCLYYSMSRNCN